jgi:hypothetical protein
VLIPVVLVVAPNTDVRISAGHSRKAVDDGLSGYTFHRRNFRDPNALRGRRLGTADRRNPAGPIGLLTDPPRAGDQEEVPALGSVARRW